MSEAQETTKRVKTSPKDFFLHLLMLVTLYGSIISILTVVFQSVNLGLPDALQEIEYYRYQGSLRALRSGLAAFIIMFPAYLSVMWGLGQIYRRQEEKRELAIRRWLIYVTLFIGSIVAIVDLIIVLNNFLNGEITLRFILKALSVFVVVGVALVYYTLDLKQSPRKNILRGLKIGSIIVSVALLVIGFWHSGSPGEARQEGFDAQRVRDLETIHSAIQNERYRKIGTITPLPETLDEIGNRYLPALPTDPITDSPYEYVKTDEYTYQLCATFAQASRPEARPNIWEHPAGRHCFDQSVDMDNEQDIQSEISPKIPRG